MRIKSKNNGPWYAKYLSVYGTSFDQVPASITEQVAIQLKERQSPEPLVTISIIAYNEEKNLLACLWSLSDMKLTVPVEIIGVNNNSKDRTEEIFQRLELPYYNEERQGHGFARQCGLERAKGKYIICIDADAVYPPHYVATHLEALQKGNSSCAFSLWSFMPKPGQSAFGLFMYESLRDLYLNAQYIKRPELCVRGMVFSFKADYGRKVGFRTDIKRGSDGSLALALKKYGKIAFIRSRKARAMTGYGTLNVDGSLSNSFKIRFMKAIRQIPGLFTRKATYKDEASNLIDKTPDP